MADLIINSFLLTYSKIWFEAYYMGFLVSSGVISNSLKN